jgi:hypothetical protein
VRWAAQTAQRSVDNSFDRLPELGDPALIRGEVRIRTGEIMAKRKKQSKAPKRKAAMARGKARKAAKRTAARAKPKKVVRKGRLPVGPAVEIIAAEVIEQPVAVTDEASSSPAA